MSFIEFDSVYKRYKMGEVVINAADGVTFNVEQGEFCIIVGASGAGKTTVLNILGGMDDCDDGKVRVAGDLINEYDSKRLIEYRRFDVGFVFQFYNLVPNLTALENVELATQIGTKALSPAKVLSIRVDEENKTCYAVVPEDQLSLAIGKEGQNARLAARLKGWKIDLKAE